MRILVVAPYVPYEGIRHAGGAYLLHHLRELDRLGNEVTLIAPGTPAQLAAVPSAPTWLRVVAGPPILVGRSRSQVLRDAVYRRVMAAPPGPTAESLRSVRRAGLSREARTADVIELHWSEYARFARVLRRAGVTAPVSVIEHDVDLESGVGRVLRHVTGIRRGLGLMSAPLARRLERRGLLAADLVAVFKAADEHEIRRAGVRTRVQVIEPWLDPPDQADPVRTPGVVVFTGALWRRENEDGLVWLLERVWPTVIASTPGARLQIVGAGPTERLRAAAEGVAGVDLVGEVPDLMPYYATASLFVAPLFARGGLKFKVPQAMLCGLPVVATTTAVEGVVEVAPSDCLWGVSDDPDRMAELVSEALALPAAAARVGDAAARWSAEHYSFAASIARLHHVYQGLVGDAFPAPEQDHRRR